jgi:hypothetical protein
VKVRVSSTATLTVSCHCGSASISGRSRRSIAPNAGIPAWTCTDTGTARAYLPLPLEDKRIRSHLAVDQAAPSG